MTFEVTIDELTREFWSFCLIRNTLFLDCYILEGRESKRKRKYETIKRYDRIDSRHSTMQESEVQLTDDIKQRVLNMYFDSISCKKWSER